MPGLPRGCAGGWRRAPHPARCARARGWDARERAPATRRARTHHTRATHHPRTHPHALQSGDAVNKSREASQIASQVLDGVLTQVVVGKRPVELCSFGDALIERLVAPLYKTKKSVEKGIAFPTCISVNSCVAHYSPLESEDKVLLKDGDVVKMCVSARRRARAHLARARRLGTHTVAATF